MSWITSSGNKTSEDEVRLAPRMSTHTAKRIQSEGCGHELAVDNEAGSGSSSRSKILHNESARGCVGSRVKDSQCAQIRPDHRANWSHVVLIKISREKIIIFFCDGNSRTLPREVSSTFSAASTQRHRNWPSLVVQERMIQAPIQVPKYPRCQRC
jgi:hypothetical protein